MVDHVDAQPSPVVAETRAFSEEKEQEIRAAVRWQIQHPFDSSDLHPRLTEADRRFFGYGTVQQEKANLEGFSLPQAERWFHLVFEEMKAARDSGIPITPMNEEHIAKHEGAHIRKSVEVGCNLANSTLGVHFGREQLPNLDWEIAVEFTAGHNEILNPVDEVKIFLAPSDPSWGDLTRVASLFTNNRVRFMERPRETIALVRRYLGACKIKGFSGMEAINAII